MKITKHAKIRIKERINIPKQSIDRTCLMVLEKGMSHKDATGRLRKYIDWLYFKYQKANNIKIYGEFTYLFYNQILITVIPLPSDYKNAVHKFFKKKEHNGT